MKVLKYPLIFIFSLVLLNAQEHKISTKILEKLKNKNEYPEEEKISQGQRTQSLIGYLFLAGSLTALMIVTEILRVKKEW